MSVQVSIAKAKAEFAAIVARAEAGEEVIVTRNGRPVARVAPLGRPARVVYGDLSDLRIPDDLSVPEDVVASFYPADAER